MDLPKAEPETMIWIQITYLGGDLPYDPAIPLLGIYPEENMVQKDTCTPMFIAALFTIAMTWKQPKCPLTNKAVYIYTIECYSAIKNNEIMPFSAT